MSDFKCHFCAQCTGRGCVGEMPGMGGPNQSRNFLLNAAGWEPYLDVGAGQAVPQLRLAPLTGAVENVGYDDEEPFYGDMVHACAAAGIALGIGDGTPDCKLQYGLAALRREGKKAAVFIKPYPDARLYERMEWALDVAEYVGIDIDSYNIVTMRNLVHLEKKTPAQLAAIKAWLTARGLPFVIKGIFTEEDIAMVDEVRPDVAYISNHGGRVDTRAGSTAEFLAGHGRALARSAGALWVDGGIRTREQAQVAAALGASCVLLGRPLITALCRDGEAGVIALAHSFR